MCKHVSYVQAWDAALISPRRAAAAACCAQGGTRALCQAPEVDQRVAAAVIVPFASLVLSGRLWSSTGR